MENLIKNFNNCGKDKKLLLYTIRLLRIKSKKEKNISLIINIFNKKRPYKGRVLLKMSQDMLF